MKKLTGILCILLGLVLLTGAGVLLYHNHREALRAQENVETVMPQMMEQIKNNQPESVDPNADTPALSVPDPYDMEMKRVEIDGYEYVGFVYIPALGLELPVMAQWDYERLKISPCTYAGSYKSNDFVILAHSYARHFKELDALKIGDTVLFVDMDGIMVEYEVVANDILMPSAVEEMLCADYDLTLFTCTYGGGSRITVRCDRVKD